MRTTTNLLLLSFLLALLIAPVATSHLLVSGDKTVGTVAGTRTASVTKEELSIIPNLSDFNGSVNFAPQGLKDGVYRDTVTLTAYPRHVANYHQLYRLYNNSDVPIRLKLETGEPTGETYAYQGLEASLNEKVIFPNEMAYVDVKITGDPAVGAYLSSTKIKLPLALQAVTTN